MAIRGKAGQTERANEDLYKGVVTQTVTLHEQNVRFTLSFTGVYMSLFFAPLLFAEWSAKQQRFPGGREREDLCRSPAPELRRTYDRGRLREDRRPGRARGSGRPLIRETAQEPRRAAGEAGPLAGLAGLPGAGREGLRLKPGSRFCCKARSVVWPFY